ncbi:MAG: hypothetical protein ACAI38_24250 [Myxococcota bacterium]|nr:hypothetical protein [Myxococcota bacterium]
MSQIARLIEQAMPKHTLSTYDARAEAAVRALSRMCGGDAEREVERYKLVRERLGKRIGGASDRPLDPVVGIAQQIMSGLPAIMEMVLTLAGDGPRGFAYLTQGGTSSTLVEALTMLLRGTLQFHLESGGGDAQAELTADIFRTVFPNLDRLTEFSALAQGLLVGVVPRGDDVELKLYFNTRLDTSVPHRDKVMKVLELCGLNDAERNAGIYDALYQTNGDTRFTGLGVDLADEDGRVKMYVHAPRTKAVGFMEDLVRRGIAEGRLEHARELIEATESDASSSDCEVAFAIRGSGPTTLKVTTFFQGKAVRAEHGEQVVGMIERWGYPGEPVRELFATLDAQAPVLQCYPLHGVGVELTDAARPKVNVYVQPNI